MPEQRILHTDKDGNNVILHYELDESGNETNRCVTYDRFPDRRYEYLTADQAAEKILKGERVEYCYIEELSRESLERVEVGMQSGNFTKTGRIQRVLLSEEYFEFVLMGKLSISFSIIGKMDLQCTKINIRTYIYSTAIMGKANFAHVTFSEYAEFSRTKIFGKAEFISTTFMDQANYESAEFFGEVTFSSKFEKKVSFCCAEFFKFTTLSCYSSCDADFSGAVFSGYTTIGLSSFNGKADFRSSKFKNRTSFEGVYFEQAIFRNVVFSGSVSWSFCVFNDSVEIIESVFSSPSSLQWSWSKSSRIRDTRFEKAFKINSLTTAALTLANSIFSENLLLTIRIKEQITEDMTSFQENFDDDIMFSTIGRPQNYQTKLDLLQKLSSTTPNINLENILIQGDFRCDFEHLEPKGNEPVLKPHREGDWKKAQKQYTWLAEQYRKQGSFEDEDDANMWASECGRMLTPRCSRIGLGVMTMLSIVFGKAIHIYGLVALPILAVFLGCGMLFAFPRFGKWVVFKHILGYGVRPWKVATSIGITITIFWIIFCIANYNHLLGYPNGPVTGIPWLDSLYFSIITFATVGYGDVHPTSWAASFAMIEGLLGVILNAALIVTLFRKLVR